jgi:hypothetical protein
MRKRTAENERAKRRYPVYLKDAKGRGKASIDAAASAIERFEEDVKRRDLPELPNRTGARFFKACLMAGDQRAHRQASLRIDSPRDARRAQGLLRLARGPTGVRLADQVCGR